MSESLVRCYFNGSPHPLDDECQDVTPSQADVDEWWLANDPNPDCPDEFHGADGGACRTCGWDVAATSPANPLISPLPGVGRQALGRDTNPSPAI